jgi:hypothetical protein
LGGVAVSYVPLWLIDLVEMWIGMIVIGMEG